MNAKEIQTEVIKNYLKPMLKDKGYKLNGQTWWKDKGDFFVIINLQNFSWNSRDKVDFCFNTGTKLKAEMNEKEKKKPTPHGLIPYLREGFYLPTSRKIYKYRNQTGYTLTILADLNEVINELKLDFEKYILPYLDSLNSIQDCLDKFGDLPFWGDNLKKTIEANKLI
jgi:hypothetical protein